jgi:hypothetical protein
MQSSAAGKFLAAAARRDPSCSMVDTLLARQAWQGRLDQTSVRVLRQREAEVQALDVEWRADAVYQAARELRDRAKLGHALGLSQSSSQIAPIEQHEHRARHRTCLLHIG